MLEEKQFNLSLSVKGVEKRTSKRTSELVDWIEINLENRTDQSTPIKSSPNLKKTDELNTIRELVKELNDSIAEEKREIYNIKGSIKFIRKN